MRIPSSFTTSPQGGRRVGGTSPPLPRVKGWAMSWFQHWGAVELSGWWEGALWRSQHHELLGQSISFALEGWVVTSQQPLLGTGPPFSTLTNEGVWAHRFIHSDREKFLPLLFTPERLIIPCWIFLEDSRYLGKELILMQPDGLSTQGYSEKINLKLKGGMTSEWMSQSAHNPPGGHSCLALNHSLFNMD